MKTMTAPMGWNSWDCYGAAVTEDIVRKNADFMAKHLKKYGWEYITVDIQWYEPNVKTHEYTPFAKLCIDEYSRVIPAENRFPSSAGEKGFAPLAEYVHSLGLKFGIHIMRGIPRQAVYERTKIKGTDKTAADVAKTDSICAWNTDMYGVDPAKPGAKEYYDSIFELYASWGVDFVKCDDIARELPKEESELIMLSDSLKNCGRDMVLSLSPGPAVLEEAWHLAKNANMWRITDDFWDNWDSLKEMFWRCERWQAHVKPGQFPDCDMLPLGHITIAADGIGHNTNLTHAEQITMMTLWGIFRSPLIMGGEMRDNDAFTLSLLTNDELLNLNQNGTTPLQLFRDETKAAWLNFVGSTPYIALFNLTENRAVVSAELSEFTDKTHAEEIWSGEKAAFTKTLSAKIEPHGAKLYKLI